uniref:Uncharacterized protein n=1 Tax=Oryza meridionalis TaxID=40149 RepID=A0A0E0DBI8_9ORYZ
MLDFSGNIGPFVLPAEFRAKEDDEHLDNGARNGDDKVKILESHQRTNLDITQVNKSECFSNISDQIKSAVQKKVIGPGGHARVQQLENLYHVSIKREASSTKLVLSQNPRKSLGGNGRQPRHSHSLSNWQKKQLEKLSVEKLKKRGMAWVPKGSVQIHNEKDAKSEVGTKKENGVRRDRNN